MTKAAAERFWGRLETSPGAAYVKPEASAIPWEDFAASVAKGDSLEIRQLDTGMPDAAAFHIPTRPSLAFRGNLQVAIKEARTLLEANAKLAFFAPTTGEIERLADVFSEYSVPYQIDLAGDRAPEYLRERAQSGSGAVVLIRGDVARGTAFPRNRFDHLRRGGSVRSIGDRREARHRASGHLLRRPVRSEARRLRGPRGTRRWSVPGSPRDCAGGR